MLTHRAIWVGCPVIADPHASSTTSQRAVQRPPQQPILKPGEIMRGYFASGGGDSTSGFFGEGVTFPKALAANFDTNHVQTS